MKINCLHTLCLKILLGGSILFFPIIVLAYQFDASIIGSKESYKDKDESSVIGLNMQALLYPVESQSGPYAEQAFIARAPSINVIAMTYDLDLHQRGSSSFYSGGLVVTLAEKKSNWVSQFGYLQLQGETDLDLGLSYDSDLENYWLGAGYYMKPTVMVSTTVDHTEVRVLNLRYEELSIEFGIKALFDDINLEMDIRHILYDDNGEEEENIEGQLAMDYYINPSTSIGGYLGVNRGNSDREEYDEIEINFLKFIRRYYVELAYIKTNDKLDDDQSSYGYSATFGVRW